MTSLLHQIYSYVFINESPLKCKTQSKFRNDFGLCNRIYYFIEYSERVKMKREKKLKFESIQR